MDKIKITEPEHLSRAYTFVGVSIVGEDINKLAKRFPSLPGLALAQATCNALVEKERARLLSANLIEALKYGFDPEKELLTMEASAAGVFLVSRVPDEIEVGG